MFTALKGWNLHTESYETKELFFDPIRNPNFILNRYCTAKTFFKGMEKMFSRELVSSANIAETAGSYGAGIVVDAVTRLAADDNVPLTALVFSRVKITDYNENTGRRGRYLMVEMQNFQCQSGGMSPSWAQDYFKVTDSATTVTDAVYTEIVNHIKSKWTQRINPDELTEAQAGCQFDALQCAPYSPSLKLVYYYHFNRTNIYTGYKMGETGEVDYDGGVYNLGQSQIRAAEAGSYEMHIANWASNTYDTPSIYLVTVRDPNDRTYLHKIHNYTSDVTKLLPGPLREEGEECDNLYGIELEVAANIPPNKIIDATTKPYCCAKSDATITGSMGQRYELVSTPATIKAHKKAWAQIFSEVDYKNFDVTRNTDNGFHVHVDMNAFKNKDNIADHTHQKQFAWFFCNPLNKDFHLLVSERDASSFQRFTPLPGFDGQSLIMGYQNILAYIVPPFRGIVHFKKGKNGNFITIEVRLFKGIVSLGSICKNLEYVDSIFHFTQKSNFQTNNISRYLDYLEGTPANQYSTLKEFFKRVELDDIKECSKIRHLLWNCTDPDQVLRKFKLNKITPSKAHLDVLHSLVKGAKFSINKNGELVVTETNRSRLYDLDLILQAKLNRAKGVVAQCA
jgi:hypothetical protein